MIPYQHLDHILNTNHINRFALAISGGPDSMAMAKLALQYQKNHNSTIHGLIVDHQLREDSTQEARYVSKLCTGIGLANTILTWDHPPLKTRLQEKARLARYQLLSDWCKKNHYNYLLTAHHANDLLETFLMRLTKGSSLKGLCALKPIRTLYGIDIVRPFLNLTQKELQTALQDQPYVSDPSNNNQQFERVRMRQWLAHMDIMTGFLRTYQKLQEADDLINDLAFNFAQKHIHGQDIDLEPLLDLSPYLFIQIFKNYILEDNIADSAISNFRTNLIEKKIVTLNHKKFTYFEDENGKQKLRFTQIYQAGTHNHQSSFSE